MLSEDIRNMADQFSFYVEHHTSMTFDMTAMASIVRHLRNMEDQAQQLETAQISEDLTQPEIDQRNGGNVVVLDNFRTAQNHTKTIA